MIFVCVNCASNPHYISLRLTVAEGSMRSVKVAAGDISRKLQISSGKVQNNAMSDIKQASSSSVITKQLK